MNLTGLSVRDCPKACTAEECVISGKPYCAHPRKGGLQMAAQAGDTEAIDRLHKAQKKLAVADATDRFS
jgi:hypothetical protein